MCKGNIQLILTLISWGFIITRNDCGGEIRAEMKLKAHYFAIKKWILNEEYNDNGRGIRVEKYERKTVVGEIDYCTMLQTLIETHHILWWINHINVYSGCAFKETDGKIIE